ncbi:MAG: hypothetical protein IT458_19005 [Planctomycetes bacterium]|nr:hypothetical protein [Planctomycetota bacterium]
MHRNDPRPGRASAQRGTALILAMLFTIIVAGLVVTGTLVLRSHQTKTDTSFRLYGQAAQFARAGLVEALGWCRRQTSQPVTTFAPQRDTLASPPVLDTDDPDIGIVREFEISGQIWGRYEVWKRWDTDPDPQRLAFRQQFQMEDISGERGAAGVGSVWLVRSIGYVYRRVDPGFAYNVAPNSVLGKEILETELRRLVLAPPGAAAICVRNGASASTNSRARVQGNGGAGIYYRAGTGAPTVAAGSVIGSPALSSNASYDDAVRAVFGVTEDELRSLADDRITSAGAFPSPIPSKTLYFAEVPTLSFTAAKPLRGDSIVYVRGNVDIAAGSNSFFSGFLYVDGNVTFRAPLQFNGALVVTGSVSVTGVSDFCDVIYDETVLSSLRTEIGQYRLSGAIRTVHKGE